MATAATGLVVVGLLAAPAQAQNDSPCPAGQPPGRPPGQAQPDDQTARGQYPIGECQLRLSQSIAAQGETIQAAGGGFAANSPVNLALNGEAIASATTGGNGGFTTDLRIPDDAAIGRGLITAEGADPSGDTRVLSANFTVVEAGSEVAAATSRGERSGISGMLPRTGAGIAALTATGAGFVAIGTAAVIAARRRRTASAVPS